MRALKRVEGINVVPLIDVVLVLLAIVLTISTFVASGAIKLDLPKAASAKETSPQKIEIAVNESGTMFWNGKEMKRDELMQAISTLKSDASVSVLGDKKAFFNDFIFILDRLKLQRIEKISIVTKRDA
ncbi:MAG: biopolymer transporter ExbD [Campylobacterota bacterium]